jgi:hypothetical protein
MGSGVVPVGWNRSLICEHQGSRDDGNERDDGPDRELADTIAHAHASESLGFDRTENARSGVLTERVARTDNLFKAELPRKGMARG